MDPRDEVLLQLKNAHGWKSGEELSRQMAMTRSAVWKHIVKLREEGYNIESSPRKGYRLAGSDVMVPADVLKDLAGGLFDKPLSRFLRQTASTNLDARHLAENGAPEGTFVVAESQESGKGRRARKWFSPPGLGIYLSFVLRPAIAPSEAAKITLLMSVAAAESISEATGIQARIKWPNDILAGGRKIAGILAEISTELDSINYMVVGLGVNVNIPPASPADGKVSDGAFPEELRGIATSVMIETGKEFSRARLLKGILKNFERRYGAARRDGFQSALKRWRELSDVIGKNIRVETANETVKGTVLELDRDGALVLRDSRGGLRRFLSGDIIRETR